MIWVLKGPGPEQGQRQAEASTLGAYQTPAGQNTAEEARYIAAHDEGDVCYVVTSAYHVPRAYLTMRKALRDVGRPVVLHVWGTGYVTGDDAKREAKVLAMAQAKGDALHWEDL